MGVCEICGGVHSGDGNLCDKHSLTIFQVINGLEEFIKCNPPPKWLANGLREIGWIYQQYPVTAGYFNTAEEVVETFVIDQVSAININDLEEVNYTTHPTERILTLLERALIIERGGNRLRPGRLTRRLQETRLGGYDMDTPEIKEKIKEMHGVLTLALTKSLLKEGGFLPRKIISVLDLLSEQMLAGGAEIELKVPKIRIDLALLPLPHRQRNRTVRVMSGFADGETKVIADIDNVGNMTLKESIKPYLTETRNRWRTRERELERGT